jgi:MFS family permease
MIEMSTLQVQPTGDIVLSGLRNLKMASLLQIVSSLLMGIPAIILIGAFIDALFSLNPRAIIGTSIIWFVLLFAGIILAAISIYVFLLRSVNQFASQNPEKFSTPEKLIKIGYLGGAIAILLGNLIIILGIAYIVISHRLEAYGIVGIANLVGLVLFGIGFLLSFIGFIGLTMYFLGLQDMFNSTLFLVAAIFELLLLGFVAWILVFIETDSLEKKLVSQHPPPPPPPI